MNTNSKNNGLLFYKRLLLLLVFYQIVRLLFYFYNQKLLGNYTWAAFWGGLRFDISAIAYLNLPFVLGAFIPGNFKYTPLYQRILKVAFYSVNILFIATNFIDFEYFKFTGRRSSFSLLTAEGMHNEIGGLVFSFLSEFWYLALGFILLALLFWKGLSTTKTYSEIKLPYTPNIFAIELGLFLACLALFIVAGRGGIQEKPIRVVTAAAYAKNSSPSLVLNTPFSLLKTMGKKEGLKKLDFYSAEALEDIYNPIIEFKAKEDNIDKKNLVIIILESFGRENLNIGQTPFLDSLITDSYYFENGFANGKLSIDAVPSVLSSIPSLMNQSYITSNYSLNRVYGLPHLLRKQGYTTSFFHGAFNGSQNFDEYSKLIGFEAFYGKNEYPNNTDPTHLDGKWGVFDEEFFQFFAEQLTNFQEPFFSTIFTISSHNPYVIPEKHKNKFPKGNTKIQESIAYTDYALQKFFETAKQQEWYSNTLFVLTADHTSSEPTRNKYTTNVGKFSIPILLFDPSNEELKGVSHKNFQQIDIMPTVIDYLGIEEQIVSFGKSYLSDKDFVVNYLDNIYHYIEGDYYLAFDGQKSLELYNWKSDELLLENLIEEKIDLKEKMESFIKAYIQSFNQRVIDNQLVVDQSVKLSVE